MRGPKPGEEGFVPRYPPVDEVLEKARRRCMERDDHCVTLLHGHRGADPSVANQVEAIRCDTEMMRDLIGVIVSQRIAIQVLKEKR